MAMQPRSKDCCIPPTKQMQKVVKNIFSLALHPYVAPMTDIEMLDDQNTVVFIQQLFVKGSLKDLIHGVRQRRKTQADYHLEEVNVNWILQNFALLNCSYLSICRYPCPFSLVQSHSRLVPQVSVSRHPSSCQKNCAVWPADLGGV